MRIDKYINTGKLQKISLETANYLLIFFWLIIKRTLSVKLNIPIYDKKIIKLMDKIIYIKKNTNNNLLYYFSALFFWCIFFVSKT